MFELPSRRDVAKCVITRETIEKGIRPTLVTEGGPEAVAAAAASETIVHVVEESA